jgi:hypothetical protein
MTTTLPLQLALTIRETTYGVQPIACDALIASRAFRLSKDDGTAYDVIQTQFGPECDCPDFIYRRAGIDPGGCKHVRALAAYGMIERCHVAAVSRPE